MVVPFPTVFHHMFYRLIALLVLWAGLTGCVVSHSTDALTPEARRVKIEQNLRHPPPDRHALPGDTTALPFWLARPQRPLSGPKYKNRKPSASSSAPSRPASSPKPRLTGPRYKNRKLR